MVFKTLVSISIIISLILLSCGNNKESNTPIQNKDSGNLKLEKQDKINGISFVSPGFMLEETHIQPISDLGANWISNMPFGMIKKGDAHVRFNLEWQWVSEKKSGIVQAVKHAKKFNLKVMLKPQLWGHDIFTGDFGFNTDKEWKSFENDYRDFILFYAKVADSCDIEVYCIGTELAVFVQERPDFWNTLIDDVKKVYHGKLTYAENWDAVERFPHWKKLDYVGSDAYYPLTPIERPTVDDFILGWKPWKEKLKSLSNKVNKPILFTEWGYRSTISNGEKPWDYSNAKEVSEENQVNAYKAVFETIYNEDWFAGGFLWKWFPYENSGGPEDDRFTPQNKKAEKTLRNFFMDAENQHLKN